MFYAIYAWGVPMVLTAFTAGMQFSDGLPKYIITPGFGSRRCWFESKNTLPYTPLLKSIISQTYFS